MKTLQVLTASAGILLALASPTLAASRLQQRAYDAYASGAVTTDRSGSYYYGPQDVQPRAEVTPSFRYAPTQFDRDPAAVAPDQTYGRPDSW